MSDVRKVLLTRGAYEIEYVHECACGDCIFGAPVIRVTSDGGWVLKKFHTRRLILPNRSTLEAIGLAFDWILDREAKKKRAAQEAEIATEQAAAMAEFAADLNREATA